MRREIRIILWKNDSGKYSIKFENSPKKDNLVKILRLVLNALEKDDGNVFELPEL